jgi:nucleotide-binding universal stress UspA family protein
MFKTIIWATDGSESADRALPYAKALATAGHGNLVVVHANEILGGRAGGYPVLADEDEVRAKIRRQVEEAREEGLDAKFQLVNAIGVAPAHMVAETARKAGADVIVVGTRGHAPVAGLLLGSVTQRLLHIAPCPVLAVPAAAHVSAEPREREEASVGV